jgi:hypothetical protein
MFYLIYMAIWALSFWGLVYGIANIRNDAIKDVALPIWVRNTSIGVALLQPLVFYPLWISALIPLMRDRERIESLYSIYIIDLVWIMPAFLILAWMLFRKQAFGYVLTPALFMLGFMIIFSLTVSELVKPLFDMNLVMSAIVQSGALSTVFLVAAILHLRKLTLHRKI